MLQLRSDSGQVFQTRFAATGAVTAKVPFLEGGKVFIPLNTEAAGASGEHVYQSEVSDAAKATGEAWTVGAALYWDDSNKRFTTTATGNTACGTAIQPATAAATVSPIFLFKSF
jgi:predicted RecA/RadA family phage recombinase